MWSKNMCSVRHRPMPSAPKATACAAWSGLSALVRILQLADRVGPLHQLGELLVDLRLLGLERLVDQHLHDLAGLGRHLAGDHLAGEAVDADEVAFLERPCRRR